MSKYVTFDEWHKARVKEIIMQMEEVRKNMNPGSLLGDHNRPMPYWEPES